MKNLRTLLSIAEIVPIVMAILLLKVFAPLVAAFGGPELVVRWAHALLHRLDAAGSRPI